MWRLRLAGIVAVLVSVVVLPAWAGRSAAQVKIVLQPGASAAQAVALPVAAGASVPVTVSGLLTQKANGKTVCYDAFYYNACGGSWQGNGIVNSIWLVPPGWDGGLSSVVLLSSLAGSSYPAFSADHVYHLTLNLSGRDGWMLFAAATVRGGTLADWSGSFTVDLGGSAKPPSGCGSICEVHVVVSAGCSFHKGGTPADAWYPIEKDTVLKAGDQVSCDPDGGVTFAFADNSTVTLSNLTQFTIGSFFTEGGVVKTVILLKMGEVSATVNKSEATKSDFLIVSPTGTISVRGTIFSVFYDPGSRAMLVSTRRGLVSVKPSKPGLPTAAVPAGKELEVTANTESPLAPIGKAGARGGIDRKAAVDLVEKTIGAHAQACQLSFPKAMGFSVTPIAGGWVVSVRASAGKAAGWSTWRAAAGHAIPVNALAKSISAGCPGGASTTTWTGTWKRTVGVPGNLVLKQSGRSVSGTYTWSTGGTIQGTTSGQTLTASFNETNYQGTLTLTLAGTHFTGTYTGTDKLNNGPISGTLNGTCTTGPCLQNPTN